MFSMKLMMILWHLPRWWKNECHLPYYYYCYCWINDEDVLNEVGNDGNGNVHAVELVMYLMKMTMDWNYCYDYYY